MLQAHGEAAGGCQIRLPSPLLFERLPVHDALPRAAAVVVQAGALGALVGWHELRPRKAVGHNLQRHAPAAVGNRAAAGSRAAASWRRAGTKLRAGLAWYTARPTHSSAVGSLRSEPAASGRNARTRAAAAREAARRRPAAPRRVMPPARGCCCGTVPALLPRVPRLCKERMGYDRSTGAHPSPRRAFPGAQRIVKMVQGCQVG